MEKGRSMLMEENLYWEGAVLVGGGFVLGGAVLLGGICTWVSCAGGSEICNL